MRTLIPVLVACAVVLSGCGGSGGGGSTSDGLNTNNSGVAVVDFNGHLTSLLGQVLFAASEFGQAGLDLNGDGDAADNVIHQVDPATGVVQNLGVSGSMPFVLGASRVAWATSEVSEGNQDQTGDGDFADEVLIVHDPLVPPGPTNPRITGVNMIAGSPIAAAGEIFAVVTSEFELVAAPPGPPLTPPYPVGMDLNGDGDFDDLIVRVYDAASNTVVSTNLAWGGGVIANNGSCISFSVSEQANGMMDLNMDGDMSDIVIFEYNVATQTTSPVGIGGGLPRAVDPSLMGIVGPPNAPLIVYAIDEESEGNQSFNFNPAIGDTDADDKVLAIYDPQTQTETLPYQGIAIDPFQIWGNETRLAFIALESENGTGNLTDFNVDGDADDEVPFWVDLNMPSVAVNSGVAAVPGESQLQVCGQYMIFRASEADQGPGGTNLNASSGDTDISDAVAFYFDLTQPGIPAVSTQTAVTGIICFDGFFFILGDENADGERDINEDGDTDDVVPVYYRVDGPNLIPGEDPIINDGFLAFQECPSYVRIFGNASEDRGFGDKNGDGDTDDYFLLATRIAKADGDVLSNRNVGGTDDDGSSSPFVVDGNSVFFPFVEAIESPAGFNANAASGDNDSSDMILFWVNTSCE